MSLKKFSFNVISNDGFARIGKIQTPRGNIDTPVFMPVGTQATIKGAYIKDIIKDLIPENITIIDTITPVNDHIYNTLKLNKSLNLSESKRHINIFYNGDPLSKKYT